MICNKKKHQIRTKSHQFKFNEPILFGIFDQQIAQLVLHRLRQQAAAGPVQHAGCLGRHRRNGDRDQRQVRGETLVRWRAQDAMRYREGRWNALLEVVGGDEIGTGRVAAAAAAGDNGRASLG